MKILIFLAVLSVCKAGVIPRRFNEDDSKFKSGISNRNAKVRNARLKWMEWKKMNLYSRQKVIENEKEGVKNDPISQSTEKVIPVTNVLIDESNRVSDTFNKFRNLNEQGIFGTQFWEKDATDETEKHSLTAIFEDLQKTSEKSDVSEAENGSSSIRPANEDAVELTETAVNTLKDETDISKDFNDDFSETIRKKNRDDMKDITKLQVSSVSNYDEFQEVEKNEGSHKFENKTLNPDNLTDTSLSVNKKTSGVGGTLNMFDISSPESTEINLVPVLGVASLEEETKNISDVEIINVDFSEENITDGQIWKDGDNLFNDSNSKDRSEYATKADFEELKTNEKNFENDALTRYNPDLVNFVDVTASEAIMFEQATDVINVSKNDNIRESMQTSAIFSTQSGSDDTDSEGDLATNDSDIRSETVEFVEPSELSWSELIDNFKNISGILDAFNLTETIGFEVVSDNISSVNMNSIDETQVLNDGSEIALFQEQPATGFEFLLDSETAKNILIREMLSTPGFLESELGENIAFIVDEESFSSGTEIDEFGLENSESENLSTVIGDVPDPLQGTLNIFQNSSDIVANESTEVNMIEVVSASTASSTSVTNMPRKCPQQGFCIFWFLARDRCTDNNDCGKSGLCCKIGCARTCVDV